ncbi:Trypsin-like peptidase domain-containing protein [Fodinibius salinus]|uniref:Trypsin-like peptidase domain-containing protein n=1 Tax=Fodinibius salinus TaxID=860790 RepID=A0A5D3YFC7_9BACT|nr:serine protease [Fodinibius salinus]TYP91713.1 Trypsin-like peptidase domain-containing protein [Fodinibius salinus]
MKNVLLLILIGSLATGCSSTSNVSDNVERQAKSKYYTSAFPSQGTSQYLKRAERSILRILSTAHYQNYYFKNPRITLNDIKTNDLSKIADSQVSTENSSAGTAIVLQQNKDRSLLITCSHVVTSPDTTINYFKGDNIITNKYIKSIKIKQQQSDIGFDGQKVNQFNIIASDRFVDLAMLTIQSEKAEFSKASLPFDIGNSRNLQAGSFLYILGFPKGYPMVTRGIVSKFTDTESHLLTSDAIFNPGISGGLVLASKDNYKTLDWVGMARSASVSTERILVPRPDSSKSDTAIKPYTGTPYIVPKKRISYGITQVVPSYFIAEFINDHQKEITKQGFSYSVDVGL